jgi:hypothetical protein
VAFAIQLIPALPYKRANASWERSVNSEGEIAGEGTLIGIV